jgi:hypothetical protein
MNYHLHAALARERHKTLLAEAEAFRLAKQARTHQPTARDPDRPIRRWRPRWVRAHRVVPSTETSR